MNSFHQQPQFQSTSHLVHQEQPTQNGRRLSLIVLGGLQIFLSFVCFIWCAVALIVNTYNLTFLLGMICGPFHLAHGISTTIGGFDIITRRKYVTATIALGIIGLLFLVLPFITADVTNWIYYAKRCASCTDPSKTDLAGNDCKNLSIGCHRNHTGIFLPILFLSFLIAITDIMLIGFASSTICQCCNNDATETGRVIQQPQSQTQTPSAPRLSQVLFNTSHNTVHLTTSQTQQFSQQSQDGRPTYNDVVNLESTNNQQQPSYNPAFNTNYYY